MTTGNEAMDALQMQAMLSNMSAINGGIPTAPAGAGGVPTLPGVLQSQVDPAMAQLYMQQMFQVFQQSLAQQSIAAAGVPGMPPIFPGGMPPCGNELGYTQAPTLDPIISVSVEGMKFQYQLTQDDLLKVFSRYGAVKDIHVNEAGASATIAFNQFQDAQAAMNDLNGKVLNGLEGTLRISWMSTGSATAPPFPSPYPAMPFPSWNFPPAVPPVAVGLAPAGVPTTSPVAPVGTSPVNNSHDKSPNGKGVRKYTCRFLIGIENDKDFQVARRIIGAKGANMKRIVKQTQAKLRLRGVGSGYFEGAGQKESSEPLQLCISCTCTEGYKSSVSQVEELLKKVYEEYRQYCRENGLPVPDLEIQLSENQLVYSRYSGQGGGAATGFVEGEVDDMANSPQRRNGSSRRNRRSRGKSRERDGRAQVGEQERGEPGPNAPPVEEIEQFIDDRNEARRANNFAEADRIRELLHKRGVALMDEPGGRGRGAEVTTWRYWRD